MRFTFPIAAIVAVLCCTTARAQEAAPRDPAIVMRDELVATGRPTLYEALRSVRRRWVRFRVATQRFPAVYVDSVRSQDPTVLQTLRPGDVRWVQYSTPAEARARFGDTKQAGAIHVSTRLPLSAAHPAPLPEPEFQVASGVSVSAFDLRAAWKGNRFEGMRGGGIAVALARPVARGTVLLGSAQYGRITGCLCGPGVTFDRDADILSLELGAKFQSTRARAYAPYVALLAGTHRVAMRERASRPGAIFSGNGTGWGFGVSGATGVDVRVGSRMLLSPEVRLATLNSGTWQVGRLGSFRLGTTILLGR